MFLTSFYRRTLAKVNPFRASPLTNTTTMEQATFAAGCFWSVELVFQRLHGVETTMVGYTGGHTESPTYQQVCTGTTGHAEAVHLTYDPKVVSYETLLETFWNKHDPTTKNRQGNDVGTQYRSVIFYHNEAQRQAALASRDAEQAKYTKPIVTEIVPATTFWPAEEYHQRYLEKVMVVFYSQHSTHTSIGWSMCKQRMQGSHPLLWLINKLRHWIVLSVGLRHQC
jgi:peptide-methionine (S)-S-oxide reductase